MSYRRQARVSENTWILVADRAKATIYQSIWPELEYYRKVEEIRHPQGAAQQEEIGRARPGRMLGAGSVRSIGEPPTDFRHRTAQEIALLVIERLQQGRMNNEFGRLIIVAPALMLGVLRDRMPAPLAKTVVMTVNKHLVDVPVQELMEHVDEARLHLVKTSIPSVST